MIKALVFGALISLVMQVKDCTAPRNKTACFKGRLEIKGLCSNYTIKILDGAMDTSGKMTNWIDENTGKTYTDVFALANPCSFPPGIDEGDEFYFIVSTAKDKGCNICMAYYPVPPKRVSISVLQKPCSQ